MSFLSQNHRIDNAVRRCLKLTVDGVYDTVHTLVGNADLLNDRLISSGIYDYPVKDAWRVAIKAIQKSPCEMDVTIAVIDDRALQLGISILSQSTAMEALLAGDLHRYALSPIPLIANDSANR